MVTSECIAHWTLRQMASNSSRWHWIPLLSAKNMNPRLQWAHTHLHCTAEYWKNTKCCFFSLRSSIFSENVNMCMRVVINQYYFIRNAYECSPFWEADVVIHVRVPVSLLPLHDVFDVRPNKAAEVYLCVFKREFTKSFLLQYTMTQCSNFCTMLWAAWTTVWTITASSSAHTVSLLFFYQCGWKMAVISLKSSTMSCHWRPIDDAEGDAVAPNKPGNHG